MVRRPLGRSIVIAISAPFAASAGGAGLLGTRPDEVERAIGRSVPDAHIVSRVEEPTRHRRTHRAEPEERDAAHAPPSSSANRCMSSRSVGYISR
jgi:hypothetical protein